MKKVKVLKDVCIGCDKPAHRSFGIEQAFPLQLAECSLHGIGIDRGFKRQLSHGRDLLVGGIPTAQNIGTHTANDLQIDGCSAVKLPSHGFTSLYACTNTIIQQSGEFVKGVRGIFINFNNLHQHTLYL